MIADCRLRIADVIGSLLGAAWLVFFCAPSYGPALRAEAITPALAALAQTPQTPPSPRTTTILPRGETTVTITADRQEREEGVWVAEGKVDIVYGDLRLQADRVEYHDATNYVIATGHVVLNRRLQQFTGSRLEYDVDAETGKFYDVRGNTDRDFLVQAKEVEFTGKDKYVIESGFITACKEAAPKWSFYAAHARVNVESVATIRNALFRIKGIPLIYLPFVTVPLGKKERSSGFLTPSTGTSTAKGRTLSAAYYQTLGPSADATLYGDYFSKRGFGYGLRFRMKASESTWLNFTSYTVNDRVQLNNAGGTSITANSETYLKNGFRGVANINLTVSPNPFLFRQVFSYSFHAATYSFQNSTVFLTNNFDAFSSNFLFSRQETFLSDGPVVIRNAPVIGFKSLGRRLGSLPAYFFFDAALEGLNRNRVKKLGGAATGGEATPDFVQRFDLFPRLTLPLRSFAGISTATTIGVRETFYSDSLAPGNDTRISGQNIHRNYFTFELVGKGPGLAKVYRDAQDQGKFKHVIEPEITYRYITGIDRFDRILRFDDRDVVASTNEFEYGLVNRILTKRLVKEGEYTTHELISFRLSQKYFFDPTFGGALIPGQPNQFYPLNTLTSFIYGGVKRRFSPLVAHARLSLTPGYSADFRTDYDSRFHRLRNASLAGYMYRGKLFLATTYFFTREICITQEPCRRDATDQLITGNTEKGTINNNQMQSQIGYGNLTRGLSTSLNFVYDIRGTPILNALGMRVGTRHLLNSIGRINYHWDCCGLAFEFLQYNLGLRVETLFRFSFTLKGIGSFGTLRQPERLF